MLRAVRSSIAVSVSINSHPVALARRRPMVDFPEPGSPISTALGAMS
jgi:hypothetical protein